MHHELFEVSEAGKIMAVRRPKSCEVSLCVRTFFSSTRFASIMASSSFILSRKPILAMTARSARSSCLRVEVAIDSRRTLNRIITYRIMHTSYEGSSPPPTVLYSLHVEQAVWIRLPSVKLDCSSVFVAACVRTI